MSAQDREPTEADIGRERNDALRAQAELRAAIHRALDEIGVPGPDYPANISNAYVILTAALAS